METLTGKALLEKIKTLANLSRREVAIECGYATTSKTGVVRADITGLCDAVLEAKGVVIGQAPTESKQGKPPSYLATVQKNGQITIGAVYLRELKGEVGDSFTIKIGKNGIQLAPVAKSVDEEQLVA